MDYDDLGVDVGQLANYLDSQKGGGGDGTYWSPDKGENTIRILPAHPQLNPGMDSFFVEAGFHNVDGKRQLCPEAVLKKPCPLCEMRRRLYKRKNRAGRDFSPAEESLAKGPCSSKRRYICNIIVRGKEDEGPKVWEFGIKMLEKIIRLMSSPHYGDITKVKTGRDLVVVQQMKTIENNRQIPDYDQSFVVPEATPAGTDEQIAKWMEGQHKLKGRLEPRVLKHDDLFELAFNMKPEEATSMFGGGGVDKASLQSIFGGGEAAKPATETPSSVPPMDPTTPPETEQPETEPATTAAASPEKPAAAPVAESETDKLAGYADGTETAGENKPTEGVPKAANEMSSDELMALLEKKKTEQAEKDNAAKGDPAKV